jgi:hypothetical protein
MKSMYLTKGEKAFVLAYGAVIAMTAGITLLIMSGVDGANAIPTDPSFYTFWIIFAGALSGGVSLYAARGWIGRPGGLGLARAVVGSISVAIVASLIAGTMIAPIDCTFYALVILITEFIAKPWLALAWFVVLIGAHYLMMIIAEERALGIGRGGDHRATAQLSKLSQAQLYHR